jgi:hypothetical protein
VDSGDRNGIFPRLADKSAFIDKAVLSVWGNRRERVSSVVELAETRAIGGSSRMYARLLPGHCQLTGNPFELKYGRLHSYPNVPPFRLSLRSDNAPLSAAEVNAIANSLFRSGFGFQVSQLEFTFDVTGLSFSFFREHLLTSARSITEVGKENSKTLYAGRPRSPWQLRIYSKTYSLMRVEFVLRRAWLHAHGIGQLDDLRLLRDLDVWALASFPEFREKRLASALNRMPNCWGKNVLLQHQRRMPLRFLTAVLRWRCGVSPRPFLRSSQADVLLRRMQRNMLW